MEQDDEYGVWSGRPLVYETKSQRLNRNDELWEHIHMLFHRFPVKVVQLGISHTLQPVQIGTIVPARFRDG